MKIVLVNNYNLKKILKSWQENPSPNHHLWGQPQLQKYGFDVEILTLQKYKFLKKLSDRVKFLGDLDQQLRLLLTQHKYDLVYSAHHLTTLLLSFLRMLGIFRKPIVAIVYQSWKPSFFGRLANRFLVRGYDKLLCLNETIKNHLKEDFLIPEEQMEVIEWGFDLPYYQSKNPVKDDNLLNASQQKETFILAAGKTYRDYTTLLRAFQNIDYSLKIYAFGNYKPPHFLNFDLASKVSIEEKILSWQDLLEEYRNALAIAIPLDVQNFKTYNAIGLTSLLEAMTMAKAVVITRNDFLGIDVEKEGIGFSIAPGNSEEWCQAINYLIAHPDEAREMGEKARYLVNQKYNIELFSNKLAYTLKSLKKENLQTDKQGVWLERF
jgi:glycosyltransferase involved in cell wall biosynthesis